MTVPHEPLTDVELMRQVAAGKPGAFESLFAAHAPSVMRLARALVARNQDAEDVVQNVFLAATRHASTFRGDASVRTWLLCITRNDSLRLRAATRRHAPAQSLEELGVEAGWGTKTPETLASLAERRALLKRALEQIGDESREIIILRDLEGLSGREAAVVLDLTVPAMKSRLHRARLELKAALRRGHVYG